MEHPPKQGLKQELQQWAPGTYIEQIGKMWILEGKLPCDYTTDDLRKIFSEMSISEIQAFVQELVCDIDPTVICSLATKYPKAFNGLNPNWVRKYNPQYRPGGSGKLLRFYEFLGKCLTKLTKR